MKISEKKLATLHQLSEESDPISLPNLLKKLGNEFVERSVRRWLSEMIKEGLIEKFGNKKETKYQVINRAKRENHNTKNCFGMDSIKSLNQVRRPIYERNPIAYFDFTVKAMGFDEIRVRYRQQRRAILRHLIFEQLSGTSMEKYISEQALKLVKAEDRSSFIEDIREDIREMDVSRIAVLGITPDQLKAWMVLLKSETDS